MSEVHKGFKNGDTVDYHSVIGGEITSTNHTIRMLGMSCGTPVAWITGKRAVVAIDALSKSKEQDDEE